MTEPVYIARCPEHGIASVVPAGWPRPWADWNAAPGSTFEGAESRRLPVPWVAPAKDGKVEFGSLRDEAFVLEDRVCQVCGLKLGSPVLFGVVQLPIMRETSGPGCHPRCFALALKYCPHFAARYEEDEAVAFVYHGPGAGVWCEASEVGPARFHVHPDAEPVTRAEIRELAR